MIRLILDALDMVVVLVVASILIGSYFIRGHEKNKLYKNRWALSAGVFMVFYFIFLMVDTFIAK